MNKIILICLLFVIPTALTQDCDNPLLAALSITPKLTTPAEQTGLAYCKGLEGADLCCSSTVINTLQSTIDALVYDLVEEAAARDTTYNTLRTSTTAGIPSLEAGYTTFQTNAAAAYKAVNDANTASTTPALEALVETLLPYTTIVTDVAADVETSTDNWSKYQAARATCINSLVAAQASIYCLACTSTYAANGVTGDDASDAAVDLAAAFQTKIEADCYDYVTLAQEQDALIEHYALGSVFTKLNTLFGEIAETPSGENTAEDITDIVDGITYSTKSNAGRITSEGTDPCTSNTVCDVTYTGFFNNGAVLNNANVAAGGIIVVPSVTRVLAGTRMLVAYDPSDEDNSAGVTVAFPEDPIAYLSAWRQGGLMTCVVALVAMLLF